MNDIQVFNSPQFGEVRTAGTAQEPIFCAADICRALGYANGRKAIADHCEEGDVTKRDIIDNLGRTQAATFVNESGLYSLIFGSKLESAKQFKKWVTSDVLPSIRKHGMYATEATVESMLNDPENAILMLQAYQRERKELNDKLRDLTSARYLSWIALYIVTAVDIFT